MHAARRQRTISDGDFWPDFRSESGTLETYPSARRGYIIVLESDDLILALLERWLTEAVTLLTLASATWRRGMKRRSVIADLTDFLRPIARPRYWRRRMLRRSSPSRHASGAALLRRRSSPPARKPRAAQTLHAREAPLRCTGIDPVRDLPRANRCDQVPHPTPSRLALAYIALTVSVLALFAVPLSYAWNANIGTFRPTSMATKWAHDRHLRARGGRSLGRDRREGRNSAERRDHRSWRTARRIDWRATCARGRRKFRIWPERNAPRLDLGGSSMRVVVTRMTLAGEHHLLMGRESVRFQSLVQTFL